MRSLTKAWLLAALLSGLPSTLHAVVTGANPMAATEAAGAMLVKSTAAPWLLYGCALVVHLSVSLFWTIVLDRVLPVHAAFVWAGVLGVAIAVLDLLVIGPVFASLAGLPFLPQLADHLAFALTVCWVRRPLPRVAVVR